MTLFELRTGGGRGPVRSAAVLALCAALVPTLTGCNTAHAPPRDVAVAASEPPLPPAPPVPSSTPAPPAVAAEVDEQVAAPVRIRIPAIGVNAAIGPLEVDQNNVLPPPNTNEGTGWWRAGPEPGERGPAVIAGHVDSYQGPAVFFRLREMRPGQEIHVDRADGSTVSFAVSRIERHEKNAFPTEAVYGTTSAPELRLITCGGQFDRKDRRYLDNIIVYAQPTS
ncbi:class F sortase [Saccharopolyspora sp. 5N708]|uniref:class F sortase n=1 Tax=Saccharopolyspora sp. 5N708 TaxID=3457424 RepID=UPI003FD4AFBA